MVVTSFEFYLILIISPEPMYQKILKDAEAKLQAEHDRVGKWLEENGLI